jgi:hypothetical protein
MHFGASTDVAQVSCAANGGKGSIKFVGPIDPNDDGCEEAPRPIDLARFVKIKDPVELDFELFEGDFPSRRDRGLYKFVPPLPPSKSFVAWLTVCFVVYLFF